MVVLFAEEMEKTLKISFRNFKFIFRNMNIEFTEVAVHSRFQNDF